MIAIVASCAERDAALGAAMRIDRAYARRHPRARSYVRSALAHELCVPGDACRMPGMVLVTFWAPGVRSRLEVVP